MRDQRIRATRPTTPSTSRRPCSASWSATTPGLWSLAEPDRSLQPSSETPSGSEPNRSDIEDAVEDLYAAGLIHRLGQYVFATRAAHEAHSLAG